MEDLMIIVSIPANAAIGDLDTLEVYGFSAIDQLVNDMEMAFTEVDEPFVLPIELLSFTAGLKGNAVRLDWATAQEINNDYFTIERSDNGTEFDEIMVVRGAGNSNSILTYSVDDKAPLNGTAYYRLKQTDFDGQSSTSNIVIVQATNLTQGINMQREVYPNPFTESFTMAFNVHDRGSVNVSLRDIQGKLISSKAINANKGENQFSFENGSSLPKGLYFVSLEFNGEVITSKIAKTDF